MKLILMIVLAATAASSAQAQAPGKATVDLPIVHDYFVPESLEQFMERADAVVIAKITGARDVSQLDRPRTEYDVDLVKVLKEHSDLSGDSKVCRAIGTTEYPDRLVRRFQPGFPAFTVGTEYLMFLTWDKPRGCYIMAFGPSGVGVINQATGFKPMVGHPVLSRLSGLNGGGIQEKVAALPRR